MIEPMSRSVLDVPPSRGMTVVVDTVFHRHCERSEAIHLAASRKNR